MLFMSNLTTWCRENDIPIGFCRGSVGGSLIAYILDITDVNPIIWNTNFARFANEYRIEIGDIDVDFCPSQRELVYNHIINTFGKDYTAYILAVGTLQEKGVIDEIGRGFANKWQADNPLLPKNQNPYRLEMIKEIKEEYNLDPESTKEKISRYILLF